jgi:hypothetical protein
MRDKSHLEQIEKWALRCKQDMEECQKQLTPFINAQIENANQFYKRLAKTRKGKQKIMQLKNPTA